MEECDCPAAFRSLARSFWGVSGAFPALRQVLREDDEDLLARTLYRQLVLWFRPDFARGLVDSPVEVGERGDGPGSGGRACLRICRVRRCGTRRRRRCGCV